LAKLNSLIELPNAKHIELEAESKLKAERMSDANSTTLKPYVK